MNRPSHPADDQAIRTADPNARPAPPTRANLPMVAGVSARARVRADLPVVAGMAAIAALVPLRELWPAQLALLGLLLVVPGLALLRALRVPRRAIVGTPVYIPTASVAVLIAAGLAVDLIGPAIGIHAPLRTLPMLLSVEALCAVLVIIAARRAPRLRDPRPGLRLPRVRELWPRALALAAAAGAALRAPRLRDPRPGLRLPRVRELWPLALPLAAAAGAARLTTSHGPTVAIAATAGCVVAIMLALVAAPRMTRTQLAILLYSVSLALLWSFSLRSGFVYGFDISSEYQVVHSTQAAGVWNLAHPNDAYGAMLSVTVLPAVLHNISGASDLVLLKAVYPAILALVPVFVFAIGRRFIASRYAAAAAIVLICQGPFSQQFPAIARQEIALVLFAALAAVLLDQLIPTAPRLSLAALLGLALAVSHYSTTYFAIWVLGLAVIVQLVVSTFRPLRRVDLCILGTFVVMVAGAALWYGPLTNSASNLGGLRQAISANGFQFLPNRAPGQSVLSAYFNGNTTPAIDATRYADLVAQDYAVQYPYVVPLPDAALARYRLQDAKVPTTPARAPTVAQSLNTLDLLIQQLLNVLAVLGVLYLALRRRTTTTFRILAIIGAGALTLLAVIRLSGTLQAYYNQTRALVQGLVVLGVCIAAVLEWGVRRLGRVGWVGVAAMTAGAAILLSTNSGLVGATLGTGAPVNLADHGQDYEQFYVTAPELASARWVGTVEPANDLLYADDYGQLRIFSQLGQHLRLLTDITPQTIDQHAWIYASATNIVDGRASSSNSGYSATYQFPALFLAENFNTVYSNGSSEVFHR
jgi:uncharacterized membrane protein